MEQKAEQKKCAYCGKPVPQQSAGPDSPWLLEKSSYGLRAIRWNPQSQVIWDLDDFHQFCKFACAAAMITDFVDKELWRVGEQKVKREKVYS